LEALEPRLLLADDLPGPGLGPFPPAPAQVGPFHPVAVVQVALHLSTGDATVSAAVLAPGDQEGTGVVPPGDGIALYQIAVPAGTASLRLDLNWTAPPPDSPGSILVFDGVGNLLIDQALDCASPSTTIPLSGPLMTTGGVLYVGIRTGQPAGANTPAEDSTYDLRVTFNPIAVSDLCAITAYWDTTSSSPAFPASLPPIAGNGTSVILEGSLQPVNSTGNGTCPSSLGNQGGSTPCPLPLPAGSFGPVGGQPAYGPGPNAPGNLKPTPPIDARPLPGSPHEPALGILTDGAPAERVDRAEETRVELSLLLLLAPGREASRGNEPAPDPNSPSLSPPLFDTAIAELGDNDVPVQSKLSDEPRSTRPGGGPVLRPSAVPPPLTADGLLGGILVVSSTVLPPIDGSDPPRIAAATPRGEGTEPTGDERPPEWGNSQGNAILLGLSGSAALGALRAMRSFWASAARPLWVSACTPRTSPGPSGGPCLAGFRIRGLGPPRAGILAPRSSTSPRRRIRLDRPVRWPAPRPLGDY
jgi:hypothetical protein